MRSIQYQDTPPLRGRHTTLRWEVRIIIVTNATLCGDLKIKL